MRFDGSLWRSRAAFHCGSAKGDTNSHFILTNNCHYSNMDPWVPANRFTRHGINTRVLYRTYYSVRCSFMYSQSTINTWLNILNGIIDGVIDQFILMIAWSICHVAVDNISQFIQCDYWRIAHLAMEIIKLFLFYGTGTYMARWG